MKYSKQVSFGTDSSGKRIRKRFYADTKADLEKQILNYRLDLERVSNPSSVTFDDYSDHWFRTYKSGRSGKTQEMYASALRKCADLNHYEVRRITNSMCQGIVNQSWELPRTAQIVSSVLRQIFRTAVMDGIILSSPAEKLSLPKKVVSKFHLLTDEELDAVDRAQLSAQDRLFVTILRTFGLRPGEALALQPRDFDFNAGVLHITKALEMTSDNKSRVKGTKTEASRDIPIPAQLVPYFKKAVIGSAAFLLFPKADGHYYTKTAYRCLSRRIQNAINAAMGGTDVLFLAGDITLYSFRHRRATDLYYLTQRGVISTKQAAALMGHSELVFLQTYSHIDSSRENLCDIYQNASLPAVTNL